MRIQTKYLGEIDINRDQIISFSKGLLGFPDHNEFVLLNIQGNDHFKFLQDIHNKYISFLLINPWDFFNDYDIDLSDEKLGNIGIDPNGDNDMHIYSIVTMRDSLQTSTCNLLAPIVINLRNREGKQFVLDNSPYTTKHMLFSEGEEPC